MLYSDLLQNVYKECKDVRKEHITVLPVVQEFVFRHEPQTIEPINKIQITLYTVLLLRGSDVIAMTSY